MKRWYEWRLPNGEVHIKLLCNDACEFWLQTCNNTTVHVCTGQCSHHVAGPNLTLYVSATGEKVDIEGVVRVKARLYNEPLTTWVYYNEKAGKEG